MDRLSGVAANAAANAVVSLLADGFLRLYDGARPASADMPVTRQRQLAELRFAAVPFVPAVDGLSHAQAIRRDFADESGRATWFRCVAADGRTTIVDGSVGLSGADLNLSSVDISAGAEITVTAFRYTQSKS